MTPPFSLKISLTLLLVLGCLISFFAGCGSGGGNLPVSGVFSIDSNSITGFVKHKTFLTPLSGVNVGLKDTGGLEVLASRTDSKGKYLITGIQPGTYNLVFFLKDFTTSSTEVVFASTSDSQTFNVDLFPATLFSIKGQVFDLASPTVGLSSVAINAVDSNSVSYTGFTDASGSFNLSLPNENYTFTYSRDLFRTVNQIVSISDSGVTTPASLTILLEKVSGVFSGQVVNQVGGKGVNNILISLTPQTPGVATPTPVLTTTQDNLDGTFSIEAAEGPYTLKATATGFSDFIQNLVIVRNSTSSQTIQIVPQNVTITGTVRDLSNGSLIPNAVVQASTGPGAVTSASGTYTINGLPIGAVTLTFSKGSYAQEILALTFAAGETLRTADIGLEQALQPVSLAGTVSYLSGFVASEFSAGPGLTVDIVEIPNSIPIPAAATGLFVVYFEGLDDTKLFNISGVIRRKDNQAVLTAQNLTVLGAAAGTFVVP